MLTPRLCWRACARAFVSLAMVGSCLTDRVDAQSTPRPTSEIETGVVRVFVFAPGIDPDFEDIGTGTRPWNFGDDSGEYANDGECDDPRFTGDGMADPPSDNHRMHDATDCRRLHDQRRIGLAAGASTGTGFVVAPGGYVVTNFHVIADIVDAAHTGLIWETDTGDDPREVPFEIVRFSRARDLALLRASTLSADRQPLAIIDLATTSVEKTDPVQAVGFPGISDLFNPDAIDFSSDWTGGQVQDILEVACEPNVEPNDTCSDGSRQVLQHGADISGGNSGGPLMDQCGNVVGINTFVTGMDAVAQAGGARRLFAVSSSELIPLLRESRVPFELARDYCRGTTPVVASMLSQTITMVLAAGLLALSVVVVRSLRAQRAAGSDANVLELIREELARRVGRMTHRVPPVAVMQPKRLLAGRGEARYLRCELGDTPVTIGSSEHSDLRVDNAVVSGRHARIGWDVEQQRFWLEDLGSLNGTYLANGTRLSAGERRHLEDGEAFYIVHERLGFYVLLPK